MISGRDLSQHHGGQTANTTNKKQTGEAVPLLSSSIEHMQQTSVEPLSCVAWHAADTMMQESQLRSEDSAAWRLSTSQRPSGCTRVALHTMQIGAA